MLSLAVVMLNDPSLMSQINTSLLVFAASFLITGLVLRVHRMILPRFGVYLGDGLQTRESRKRLRRRKAS